MAPKTKNTDKEVKDVVKDKQKVVRGKAQTTDESVPVNVAQTAEVVASTSNNVDVGDWSRDNCDNKTANVVSEVSEVSDQQKKTGIIASLESEQNKTERIIHNNGNQFELDSEKYRKLNSEKCNDISNNDLLCILMVRGMDSQNPVMFGDAKRLYEKINNINKTYNHENKQDRPFNNDRPPRTFNNDRPPRTFNSDRPPRTFNSDRPERTFNSDRPERTFNNDRPERTFNSDRPPRTFNADKPYKPFNSDTNTAEGNNKYNDKPEYGNKPKYDKPYNNKYDKRQPRDSRVPQDPRVQPQQESNSN